MRQGRLSAASFVLSFAVLAVLSAAAGEKSKKNDAGGRATAGKKDKGKNGAKGEKVLILEQDYTLVDMDEKGPKPKAVRQLVYITPGQVQVDEYAAGAKRPKETVLLDLDREEIYNIDHKRREMTRETFDARRKRLEKQKENIRRDLKEIVGPQREKVRRLYKGMLDDERRYKADMSGKPETLAGVECRRIRIYDLRERDYSPLTMYVHPKIKLPYDSEEALYLLKLVGRRLADFMRKNKALLRSLPMKLHLQTAGGGTLDVTVRKVRHSTMEELRPRFSKQERTLFKPPSGYTDPRKRLRPGVRHAERPD